MILFISAFSPISLAAVSLLKTVLDDLKSQSSPCVKLTPLEEMLCMVGSNSSNFLFEVAQCSVKVFNINITRDGGGGGG